MILVREFTKLLVARNVPPRSAFKSLVGTSRRAPAAALPLTAPAPLLMPRAFTGTSNFIVPLGTSQSVDFVATVSPCARLAAGLEMVEETETAQGGRAVALPVSEVLVWPMVDGGGLGRRGFAGGGSFHRLKPRPAFHARVRKYTILSFIRENAVVEHVP